MNGGLSWNRADVRQMLMGRPKVTKLSRYVIPLLAVGALSIAGVSKESGSMKAKFLREAATAGLPAGNALEAVVSEADISSLPPPVQRYFHFMGVVGRSRDWSFRVGASGRFRTKPDQSWMPMKAWQYDSRLELARIFHVCVRFFGLLPVLGRDTYIRGRGRMLIRPLDLFTVEDVKGPEVDMSELVTYLNDAVLFAPSFLLDGETTWAAVGPDSFDVSITHGGYTVTGRVLLDERGAPRDFSTTDRVLQNPYAPNHELIRARWTTPIDGWQTSDGRAIPTSGTAIWHLSQGEFAYAEMRFATDSVAFNVRPGE